MRPRNNQVKITHHICHGPRHTAHLSNKFDDPRHCETPANSVKQIFLKNHYLASHQCEPLSVARGVRFLRYIVYHQTRHNPPTFLSHPGGSHKWLALVARTTWCNLSSRVVHLCPYTASRLISRIPHQHISIPSHNPLPS